MAFTAVVIILLAVAVADTSFVFIGVQLVTTLVVVMTIHRLFPGSRFFAIALANFIAIYACVYVFFVENNFGRTHAWVIYACFSLPLLAFMAGAVVRRARIRSIVEARRFRDERHFGRIFLWLLPMVAIGALTFAVPAIGIDADEEGAIFAGTMGLIALIVFGVSANVASFLLDTGLLFEAFFERVAQLVVPAFAFLTFYSLTIIVFASVYRVIDRFTLAKQFKIDNVAREISFSESLYFSVVTMSTVGYGDIVPATSLVRVVVSLQIVSGVILLLFGFNEILNYARQNQKKSS